MQRVLRPRWYATQTRRRGRVTEDERREILEWADRVDKHLTALYRSIRERAVELGWTEVDWDDVDDPRDTLDHIRSFVSRREEG